MTLNNFDSVAGYYDLLASIVYGKAIREAQIILLKKIKPGSKVLVLGGGTGWLIKEIFVAQPDCVVYYIEASQNMIELAKKYGHHGPVHFIHGNENAIPESIAFDMVITNFYLDMFKPESLKIVIARVARSLKTDAVWIITDFKESGRWWNSILLWVMYKFFRLTCHIEADRLPDWAGLLEAQQFRRSESQYFFRGFIESTVWSTTFAPASGGGVSGLDSNEFLN